MQIPSHIEELSRELAGVQWRDADDEMERTYVIGTEIGRLVQAFSAPDELRGKMRLRWLVFFAARRALPCWDLYCDSDKPLLTVKAMELVLNGVEEDSSLRHHTSREAPAYRGVPIVDCRFSDTACASGACSEAAQFFLKNDLFIAVCALSSAYMAFDQSPMGQREKFKKWLLEVAVPAAWNCQELTLEEQYLFRSYDIDSVTMAREDYYRKSPALRRKRWARITLALILLTILLAYLFWVRQH